MRKETINIITIYMIIGAVINAAVLFLIGDMDITSFEKLATIIGVNACYIAIARDIAKAHEISCSKKKINKHEKHPSEGAHARGG